MESGKLRVDLQCDPKILDRFRFMPMLRQLVRHQFVHVGGFRSDDHQAEHCLVGEVRIDSVGAVEDSLIRRFHPPKNADDRRGFIQVARLGIDVDQLHAGFNASLLFLHFWKCFLQIAARLLEVARPLFGDAQKSLYLPQRRPKFQRGAELRNRGIASAYSPWKNGRTPRLPRASTFFGSSATRAANSVSAKSSLFSFRYFCAWRPCDSICCWRLAADWGQQGRAAMKSTAHSKTATSLVLMPALYAERAVLQRLVLR